MTFTEVAHQNEIINKWAIWANKCNAVSL